MYVVKKILVGIWGIAVIGALAACSSQFDYPPLVFEAEGNSLIARGVIDDRAPQAFDDAMADNPQTDTIVLAWVPGSVDDEYNLKLARALRAKGLKTYVPSGGIIASGGTDLFLAGKERRLAPDACVGVHTWGDDHVGIGSEVPKDDPIHEWYLTYYDDMSIEREFYWFTLKAAGPDDSHWMSADEINRFKMTTKPHSADWPTSNPSPQTLCDQRYEQTWLDVLEEDK